MANIIKAGVLATAQLDCREKPFSELVDLMISHLRMKLEAVLVDRPDIVLFPECCDKYGDFTTEQWLKYIDMRGEKILDFLASVAQKHRCYICYPTVRKDADGFLRNSLQIIGRDGTLAGIYDKACPPIGELDDWHIKPGVGAKIIELDFGRVAPLICFDLNFKYLKDEYISLKPDIILFSSMFHGSLMQLTWAYECRAYFVSAVHNKESRIISPVGQVLAATTNYYDSVVTDINLDCKVVSWNPNKEKIRDAKIKYGSDFQISDPGYLSSILLSSLKNDMSIEDIITEYKIDTLDDYLNRSIEMIKNKKHQKNI
jgi:predicted amidohydrolase